MKKILEEHGFHAVFISVEHGGHNRDTFAEELKQAEQILEMK